MDILTTPWRMAYILAARSQSGCIFCDLLAREGSDAERFILERREHAFLVLNIYPYTPGHLLAVPYRHTALVNELTSEELAELFALCQTAERLLRRAYGCRSVHTGANLGRAAGAGVPDHLHFHIVAWPEGELRERWDGAESLPESLEQTYQRLMAARALPRAAGGA
ncbi:MAG: HIT domain-containing protein [Candidatus Eisenbacteria sp.]|nr:HIT domain-containing protein [Candidatus Eisenbacteria bacterium]